MKKTLILVAFSFFSITAMAETGIDRKSIKEMTVEEKTHRAQILEKRLIELKGIPVDSLDRDERKTLRKETREIRKEMKALQGAGIYISGTAILVLLLVLLLI